MLLHCCRFQRQSSLVAIFFVDFLAVLGRCSKVDTGSDIFLDEPSNELGSERVLHLSSTDGRALVVDRIQGDSTIIEKAQLTTNQFSRSPRRLNWCAVAASPSTCTTTVTTTTTTVTTSATTITTTTTEIPECVNFTACDDGEENLGWSEQKKQCCCLDNKGRLPSPGTCCNWYPDGLLDALPSFLSLAYCNTASPTPSPTPAPEANCSTDYACSFEETWRTSWPLPKQTCCCEKLNCESEEDLKYAGWNTYKSWCCCSPPDGQAIRGNVTCSTPEPTVKPTVAPTATPTAAPTAPPTTPPTAPPTASPTVSPTVTPTVEECPFDCAAGFWNWDEGFSEKKKECCCSDNNLPNFDKEKNLSNTNQYSEIVEWYPDSGPPFAPDTTYQETIEKYRKRLPGVFNYSRDDIGWFLYIRNTSGESVDLIPSKYIKTQMQSFGQFCGFTPLPTPMPTPAPTPAPTQAPQVRQCTKFVCIAGLANWRTGWSQKKKECCCDNDYLLESPTDGFVYQGCCEYWLNISVSTANNSQQYNVSNQRYLDYCITTTTTVTTTTTATSTATSVTSTTTTEFPPCRVWTGFPLLFGSSNEARTQDCNELKAGESCHAYIGAEDCLPELILTFYCPLDLKNGQWSIDGSSMDYGENTNFPQHWNEDGQWLLGDQWTNKMLTNAYAKMWQEDILFKDGFRPAHLVYQIGEFDIHCKVCGARVVKTNGEVDRDQKYGKVKVTVTWGPNVFKKQFNDAMIEAYAIFLVNATETQVCSEQAASTDDEMSHVDLTKAKNYNKDADNFGLTSAIRSSSWDGQNFSCYCPDGMYSEELEFELPSGGEYRLMISPVIRSPVEITLSNQLKVNKTTSSCIRSKEDPTECLQVLPLGVTTDVISDYWVPTYGVLRWDQEIEKICFWNSSKAMAQFWNETETAWTEYDSSQWQAYNLPNWAPDMDQYDYKLNWFDQLDEATVEQIRNSKMISVTGATEYNLTASPTPEPISPTLTPTSPPTPTPTPPAPAPTVPPTPAPTIKATPPPATPPPATPPPTTSPMTTPPTAPPTGGGFLLPSPTAPPTGGGFVLTPPTAPPTTLATTPLTPSPTTPPTSPPTAPPTLPPTTPPTTANETAPATTPPTSEPTEPPTLVPTEPPTSTNATPALPTSAILSNLTNSTQIPTNGSGDTESDRAASKPLLTGLCLALLFNYLAFVSC